VVLAINAGLIYMRALRYDGNGSNSADIGGASGKKKRRATRASRVFDRKQHTEDLKQLQLSDGEEEEEVVEEEKGGSTKGVKSTSKSASRGRRHSPRSPRARSLSSKRRF
jgi:hypothetical protein